MADADFEEDEFEEEQSDEEEATIDSATMERQLAAVRSKLAAPMAAPVDDPFIEMELLLQADGVRQAPPPRLERQHLLIPSAMERRAAFDRWDTNDNGGAPH